MLWNRKYQEFDLVVSSVTTKVKGVAQMNVLGAAELVWDVVDYSGPGAQVGQGLWIPGQSVGGAGFKPSGLLFQNKNSFFVLTNVIVTKNQKQGKCPEVLPISRLILSLVSKLVSLCCSVSVPGSQGRQIMSH